MEIKGKRILITAIGSMSASSVIKSLRSTQNNIVGCDINPTGWLPNAREVDFFEPISKATDADYLQILINICRKHQINYIIPLTDPEVDVISKNIHEFSEQKIFISTTFSIETLRNKYLLYKAFENSTIQCIPTFSGDLLEPTDVKQKMIGKPKNGRSSEGIIYVENYEHLLNYRINRGEYIFQPFLEGSVITVDYIRDRFGNEFCLPRKELLRSSNGAGLTVEIYQDKLISSLMQEIGKKFNILGSINVEFLHHQADYLLMDINPRFSAGVGFSTLAGYDFVKNSVRVFEGQKINMPENIRYGLYAKTFRDIIL